MRIPIVLLAILCADFCLAQTALYNAGNIRIHEGGNLGIHTNLINDSSFSENQGLAGFYGNQNLEVSGAFAPIFFDLEIVNAQGVFLTTTVGVENNANFVEGDFQTSRIGADAFLDFASNSFYSGEGDLSKVDGYAAYSGASTFTFPTGDEQQLRTLRLNASGGIDFAKCAYFFQNPDTDGWNTGIRTETLANISQQEFWKLEGNTLGTVTLSWNPRSNMGAIAPDLSYITLVGWNISQRQWISLGSTFVSGDLNSGTISSVAFVPDDYAAITFGSLAEPEELLVLDNYWLSPNNDGINDVLIIPELELSPNNLLQIFDRNGIRVFQQENYRDEFEGLANTGSWVINPEQGLPTGIYYYTADLYDLDLRYQGYLYLER